MLWRWMDVHVWLIFSIHVQSDLIFAMACVKSLCCSILSPGYWNCVKWLCLWLALKPARCAHGVISLQVHKEYSKCLRHSYCCSRTSTTSSHGSLKNSGLRANNRYYSGSQARHAAAHRQVQAGQTLTHKWWHTQSSTHTMQELFFFEQMKSCLVEWNKIKWLFRYYLTFVFLTTVEKGVKTKWIALETRGISSPFWYMFFSCSKGLSWKILEYKISAPAEVWLPINTSDSPITLRSTQICLTFFHVDHLLNCQWQKHVQQVKRRYYNTFCSHWYSICVYDVFIRCFCRRAGLTSQRAGLCCEVFTIPMNYWQLCAYQTRWLVNKDILWSPCTIYRHRHHTRHREILAYVRWQTHTVHTHWLLPLTINKQACNKTLPNNNCISYCNHGLHISHLLAPLMITWHSCVPLYPTLNLFVCHVCLLFFAD